MFVLLCITVNSSFAFILKMERKLVALLLLSYRCIVTIKVLWLFLTVSWVGLQCVIVVFPDHTYYFSLNKCKQRVHCQWEYNALFCILYTFSVFRKKKTRKMQQR